MDDDITGDHIVDKEKRLKISQKLSNIRTQKDLDENIEIASFFRMRNIITKSLGSKKNSQLNIDIIPVEKGDRFLVTSDGIHDNLTTEEIQEIIKQSSTIEEIVKNLIDKSLVRSRQSKKEEIRAKPDDMSVILINIK